MKKYLLTKIFEVSTPFMKPGFWHYGSLRYLFKVSGSDCNVNTITIRGIKHPRLTAYMKHLPNSFFSPQGIYGMYFAT